MIFFSIGLPSRFAEWCDVLACRLAERALGPTRIVAANALEELGRAVVESDDEHLVVAARQPTAGLLAALATMAGGFVVVLDDPRAALQNLVLHHAVEWAAAVRATASSCAAMLAYTGLPRAVALHPSGYDRDPVATARIMASCYGLELNPQDVAACVDGLPEYSGAEAEAELDRWWGALDPAHRDIGAGALMGYADRFAGHGLGGLVWRRELFLLGDDPQQPASGVVALTGGVRNLLFGPFIALPPGRWSCTVTFAVSKEAASMSFSLEIVAGVRCVSLAQALVQPDAQGLCQTTLRIEVAASTDQPISLRLLSLQPAEVGRLVLGEAVVTAQTSTRAPIPLELSRALGL